MWSAAELAVALRQTTPDGDAVDRDVADLTLMKTWAMRGTLHLLRPQDAGAFLSLMADAGSWLKPSWTKASGVSPKQVDELTNEVARHPGRRRRADPRPAGHQAHRRQTVQGHGGAAALRLGLGAQAPGLAGRPCHGVNQGNKITFTSPAKKFGSDWKGIPEPDDAARVAIAAYLGAYGPATMDTFDRWLTSTAPASRSCAGGSRTWTTSSPRSTSRAARR